MNYLVFAIGFVCLVSGINGASIDTHRELRQKCLKEVGLNKDELSASGSATFLQNPKAKCYLKCFSEDLKLHKDDNTLDVERAIGLVDEDIREQARPLFNKCGSETNDVADRCEKSYQVVKCLYGGAPGIFQQLGVLEPPRKP